jgi:predicted Fe-Mo cluster-binding NifX family protein
MKIAIPTKNNQVDDHFGHCEYFTVFAIENNKIIEKENVPSLQGCGCKSNIIFDLKEKGVELMLAGNMGQGAFDKLVSANINVIRGCRGSIDSTIESYLKGGIKDSLIMCGHTHGHEDGHVCNH